MMEDFIVENGKTGHQVERQGKRNPHISPNNLYRTRDGRWLALPASTDTMWRRLLTVMDAPDLAEYDTLTARLEHREETEARAAESVAAHALQPPAELLLDAGGAPGPVH